MFFFFDRPPGYPTDHIFLDFGWRSGCSRAILVTCHAGCVVSATALMWLAFALAWECFRVTPERTVSARPFSPSLLDFPYREWRYI